MFDIGWSEFAVIAVVALIAIGPKELPGVLRMVGQWVAKARKMAGEFQGQFQEAMREAEMADLKKSFDEVKEAASGFASGNVMTSLQKDVSSATFDASTTSRPQMSKRPHRRKKRHRRRKPQVRPLRSRGPEPLAIAPPENRAAAATPERIRQPLRPKPARDAKAS